MHWSVLTCNMKSPWKLSWMSIALPDLNKHIEAFKNEECLLSWAGLLVPRFELCICMCPRYVIDHFISNFHLIFWWFRQTFYSLGFVLSVENCLQGLSYGDGRLFSCGADGSIHSWTIGKKGELEQGVSREKAHKDRVSACLYKKVQDSLVCKINFSIDRLLWLPLDHSHARTHSHDLWCCCSLSYTRMYSETF